MINKSKKLKLAAVAAAVAVAGTVTVYAAYDSSKDPIVSLSYLSQVFKPEVKSELKTELKNEIKSELKTELKSDIKRELESEIAADINSAVNAAKDAAKNELRSEFDELYSEPVQALQEQLDILMNEYETVTLEKGKRLTASAACELLLLSGSATVRCSATDSGLIDCTDGVILYDGQNVPVNHKLLVPDNGDGRGITVTAPAQILVKGGYTVG